MVFVAKNGLRSDLRVYNFTKFSWRECAPVPLTDVCHTCTMVCPHDLLIQATPLLASMSKMCFKRIANEHLISHTSAYIPDPSLSIHLVVAYSVALFQCFQMVPVSFSSGEANKACNRKTAPLLHLVQSNRLCTFLHKLVELWILLVDLLIHKTTGRFGAYSFYYLGKRFGKLTRKYVAVD